MTAHPPALRFVLDETGAHLNERPMKLIKRGGAKLSPATDVLAQYPPHGDTWRIQRTRALEAHIS
jgi:hypothetical protein